MKKRNARWIVIVPVIILLLASYFYIFRSKSTMQNPILPLGNDDKLYFADFFDRLINRYNLKPDNEPKFDDKSITFSIEGIVIVMPKNHAELTRKITSLQILLQRFKIEGRKPKAINLLFEKAVVNF